MCQKQPLAIEQLTYVLLIYIIPVFARTMRIMSIVGARPQFIKLAPLSKELRKRHDETVVHTGQHYDFKMSKIFFRDLKIPNPDFNLGVGSGSHACQTGQMMIRVEKIMMKIKPDIVIVFGDTNSTLAASIAASKLNIPTAHVEAGLRNWDMHFPEEVNRIVSDRLAVLNFAPTSQAMKNLKKEGLSPTARLTGDVMLDCLLQNITQAKLRASLVNEYGLAPKSYNLLTLHRPDNVDDVGRLFSILSSIKRTGIATVFPVHPRTKKVLGNPKFDRLATEGKIILLEPMGYLDFIQTLGSARTVITDSGGVQKEAYIVGTPCITLLESTPWVETVSAGWNLLLGTDIGRIPAAAKAFDPPKERKDYYGDGTASSKIVAEIEQHFASR